VKPDVGVQAVRQFIEKDRVDAVVGLSLSNVLMAVLPRLGAAGVPAIATDAGPSAMAGAQCQRNVFTVAWQNDGAAEAMGQQMLAHGFKRTFVMAPNYQAGKDMVAGFKRSYRGTVVEELYTQVNQPDYAAELAQVAAVKPEALFVFYPGSMGIQFIKQLRQAGINVPVYSVFTVDGTTLPALRDAAVDVVSGAMWDAALDVPESRRFVKAFEAKYKRTPSQFAATAYDAAKLLDNALRRVPGASVDREALVRAVREAGADFKSVRGPFKFNTNNLPIQNYYTFKVVKEKGGVG
jgi:branched-chain amino acid transport system substrate-binding protein